MTAIRTPDDEVHRPGWFYAPFREGWTYQGITYPGHSDFSVDWNRRTPAGGWLQDEGDPVLAAADGTVSEVDKDDGLVMVNHHGGLWRSEYRHMTGIRVKVGDKVERSDRLGSIGNVAGDGRSFGAHLHHVHWTRDKVSDPWRRTKMRIEDEPVATSVHDSDSQPDAWTPPPPVYVVGPPPKATWESAYRQASTTITRLDARLDAQKAQTALATEERDTARAEAKAATERAAMLEADLATCRDATPIDCSDEIDRALAAEQRLADIRTVLDR